MNDNEPLNKTPAEIAAANEASTEPAAESANVEAKAEEKDEKGKKDEALTGKQKACKEIREWVVSLVVALLVVLLCRSYLFMPIRVDGASMYPTLNNGDRLGVTAYDVRIENKLQRGDVVICHYPGRTNKLLGLITVQTDFVKRIVGMPGDTVSRVSGVTYINGEALDPSKFSRNPTVQEKDGRFYSDGQEVTLSEEQLEILARSHRIDYEYVLGDDEYFVVGDNRYNSHDSRWWNGPNVEMYVTNDTSGDVGPITSDMILGRAKFVFWPLDGIRSVETDPSYVDPKDQ